MSLTDQVPSQIQATRTFDREADTVPTARSWTTGIYTELGATEDLLDACALLISEVVTNAVLHGAGTEYTVVIKSDLWISVWDASPVLPRHREHALTSEGGRGLELLEMLAPGYTVEEDATRGGKCVCFQPKGWT
ncbi:MULTISPECIES: ATP-binding protein [unclassified Streptomyces]|uniref:ATP-binding protein n=1 Tax=unclassified Streptomyces TaxID=2593676 RepID=UPI002E2C05C0|nr:ATP-binding protein [Streptomyces sp. NBC_00285]